MAGKKNTNKNDAIKKDIEKDIAIKKEIRRIKSGLKNIHKDTLKMNEGLIEHAAYLQVTLVNMKKDLDEINGWTCEYQNGENQFGKKKSPEAEVFITLDKSYREAMKQINELIPKGTTPIDDGFEEFANGKG